MSETTPMRLSHARAFIDRAYSETGRFQWVRETAMNAIEAGATRVHFGLERSGVKHGNVYRRFIADNGCGMDEYELVDFFRTLGGSSKSVGGAHENYGIGAKITLLPWNTEGLVVASWKNGEGNVIWAKADAETSEYGLRKVPVDGEMCDVWPTGFDPDLGFSTEDLRPEWLHEHGTVVLLVGDAIDQHTMRSDPRRDPSGTRQIRDHLTRRFWTLPENLEITVDELQSDKKSTWWHPDGSGGTLNTRKAPAMNRVITDLLDKSPGAASGVVDLDCGSRVHWMLGEPDAVQDSWSWQRGFIAARYKGELYEHKNKHYDFRLFGVAHKPVTDRLWLMVDPKLADSRRRGGAFPESDRSSLLWSVAGESQPLPWVEWGMEFAQKMPDPIRQALDQHRKSGQLRDNDYRERLADLFGERFKMPRLRVESEGDAKVLADAGRMRTRDGRRRKGVKPKPNENSSVGQKGGPEDAVSVQARLGIPRWEECGADDLEKGTIAAWVPNHVEGPTVLLNVQHPVIVGQVAHWTEHYPHLPSEVEEVVRAAYGECAVAAIAHSEQLKRHGLDRRTIEEQLRTPYALTLALLGLMPHDRIISDRLASKYGKRHTKEQTV